MATTEETKVYKADYSPRAVIIKSLITVGISGLVYLFAYLGAGQNDILIDRDQKSKLTILQTAGSLALAIQWIVFIPSFIFQTEKFYDLTGSLTYATIIIYTFFAGRKTIVESGLVAKEDAFSLRAVIVTVLVLIWGARLGFFLFRRVLKAGKDGRFDRHKPDFFNFLLVWTLQGLWVFLTAYTAFIINSDQFEGVIKRVSDGGRLENELQATDYIGIAIWAVGFVTEVTADYQKQFWQAMENKKHPFIDYGLWYYSRHPNYFGEMTLWWGVYFLSIGVLNGRQHTAIISPIFVFLLINFVSGVRLLEKRSDEKFGALPEYWDYKRNTSSLIPLPKGWCGAKTAPGVVTGQ